MKCLLRYLIIGCMLFGATTASFAVNATGDDPIVTFKIISLNGVSSITAGHIEWTEEIDATFKVAQPNAANPSGLGNYPAGYNALKWYREADYNETANTFSGTAWDFTSNTVDGAITLIAYDNVMWDQKSAERTLTETSFSNILVQKNFSLTATLTINANRTVTIQSIDAGNKTITSAAVSRHLSISGGIVNLTFTNVTLYGNRPTDGGGIKISGATTEVTLNNAVIKNCKVSSAPVGLDDGQGGGILNDGRKLTIIGGEISGNEAIDTGGKNGDGGGIFSTTALEIKSGIISGNVAANFGGGICSIHTAASTVLVSGGEISSNWTTNSVNRGGGIFIGDNCKITISDNARIIGNGVDNSGVVRTKFGGGISVYGTLEMTGGEISGNVAQNFGGGIFNYSTDAVKISGGKIKNNWTTDNTTFGFGGGIYSYSNVSKISISGDAEISGNGINQNSNTVVTNRGGGIYTNGTIEITGGEISGNAAISFGGGIFTENSTASAMVISGGEISSNWTTSTSLGRGGGIYAYSSFETCKISISGDAKISGNGIDKNSKAVVTSLGGGIYTDGTIEITGGKISGNAALDSGGGIYSLTGSKITISGNTEITGNGIANNTTVTTFNGGGIYTYGIVEITGGKISGNAATNAGGAICSLNSSINSIVMSGGELSSNWASNFGGGISAGTGSKITISNSAKITGNGINKSNVVSTRLGGGINSQGILEITGGVISGNKVIEEGGGIYAADYGRLNISNSVIFSGNTATTAYDYGVANKGANHTLTAIESGITGVTGNIQNILWAQVSIPNTHALNNYDIAYRGGDPIDISGVVDPDWKRLREAINNHSAATITIHPKSATGVTENLANGILWLNDNEDFINSDGTPITLARTVELKAASKNITLYTRNGSDGRHFNVTGTSTLKMNGVIINGNDMAGGINVAGTGKLTLNGGVVTNCRNVGLGGGIYIDLGGEFTLQNGEISNNKTTSDGGGIHVSRTSTFTMLGGEIKDNEAVRGGGLVLGGTFIFQNGTISNNKANIIGGGLHLIDATLEMSGGMITGNEATNGGGIYINSGNVTVFDGEIKNNVASQNGAGVSVSVVATFIMHNGTISNNTATQNGGGIYTQNYGKINISNTVVFTGNTAAAAHDYGVSNKGANQTISAAQSGLGVSGNIQNILWAQVSIPNTHALNNYDIAYLGGDPIGIVDPDWKRLREAINNHSAATITIHPKSATGITENLANGILVLQNNEDFINSDGTSITIVRSVELKAASKNITLYTRNAVDGRHFSFTGTSTFKMDGVIINGNDVAGGIVVAGGTGRLTFNGGLITNCRIGSECGAGVHIGNGGEFTMLSGEITENTTTHRGGGVFLSANAKFTMSGGLIKGNTAERGGGVYMENTGAIFTMSDGEISNNTTTGVGGSGVFFALGATFEMHGGLIKENKHTGSENGGGGVQVNGSGTVFKMFNGTISGNTTLRHGGGVMIVSGRFEMQGGTISGNKATQNGGGIYVSNAGATLEISGGVITENEAVNGGGINFVSAVSTITLTGGTISYNTATTNGGGIFASNYSNLNVSATVVFTDNIAATACDYGVANKGANHMLTAAESGITGVTGNIQNILWAQVSIPNTHALNNYDIAYSGNPVVTFKIISLDGVVTSDKTEWTVTADASNKVAKPNAANPSGKGGYPANYNALDWYRAANYNTTTNTFSGSAWDFNSNTVAADGSTVLIAFDNVMWDQKSAERTLAETSFNHILVREDFDLTAALTISANRTVTIQSINSSIQTITSKEETRHLSITAGTVNLTFKDVTLKGNRPLNGGGIHIPNDSNAEVTLNDAVVQNCRVIHGGFGGGSGGGICSENVKTLTINGGLISGNEAYTGSSINGNGGGINVVGPLEITGVTISGNTAESVGGGIYSWSNAANAIVMNGGTISGNWTNSTDAGFGGGIYANKNGKITISGDASITGNGVNNSSVVSTNEGGGIFTKGAVEMTGGVISGNKAKSIGGGIYVCTDAALTMTNGAITNNTSANIGGGIYGAKDAIVNLIGGFITNNTAATDGGGIYMKDFNDLTVSSGVTFTGNTAQQPYWLELTTPVAHTYTPVYGTTITAAALKALTRVPNNTVVPSTITLSAPPAGNMPFQYAYNNYDVNYVGSDEAKTKPLSTENFCGGSGTPGDPYLICTAAQLDKVRDYLLSYFKLANDIDLTEYLEPGGPGYAKWGVAGWLPLGGGSTPFSGNFNGDGHKITGLWIDRNTDNIGLFGYVFNGTIENVSVVIDGTKGVKGRQYVGGLVGLLKNGTVKNCSVSGKITGNYPYPNNNYVGGLVGCLEVGGAISNSYSTGEVSGTGNCIGGLLGSLTTNCIVSQCYSSSKVAGSSSVGGLVGQMYGINVSISNSYATGEVSSTDCGTGGLVGRQQGTANTNIIKNCYATGKVTTTYLFGCFGGLVGEQSGSNVVISKCFYDINTTECERGFNLDWETTALSDVTAKTTAEMKKKITFTTDTDNKTGTPANWDFTDIWGICEVTDYPFLLWEGKPVCDDSDFCGGDGLSPETAFLICTAAQLDNVRNYLTGYYFKLANDIDLTAYLAPGGAGYAKWGDEGWEPIGDDVTPFTGKFNGDGKKITGLWINRPDGWFVGLFSNLCSAAVIDNLGIEIAAVGINGFYAVGALAGRLVGQITECYVAGTGAVNGSLKVGGMVGTYSGIKIEECFSTVNVNGDGRYNWDPGPGIVGGLVGEIDGNGCIIINCYTTGNVSAPGKVGGLIGVNSGYNCEIINCYAAGKITGSGNIGGLVGIQSGVNNTISGCFFDSQTTLQANGVGIGSQTGVTAKTTAEMKKKATFTTDTDNEAGTPANWDFTNIWGICEVTDYPFLLWEGKPVCDDSGFCGGDGTELNPYMICTPEQLDKVRDHLFPAIYFKLANDIDLTGYLAPGGAGYDQWGDAGWMPIGDYLYHNLGGFDGDNKKITGLWIDRGSASSVGLFGRIDNAIIANVGIEIADKGIKGAFATAALLGQQYGGSITNCYSSGNVYGSNEVGGLVGCHTNDAIISKCYSICNVTGTQNVGGLVGVQNEYATISQCYALGNVTGDYYVGGFLGRQNGAGITDCYAKGNVTGIYHAGGLVGYQENGDINNCFAAGIVNGFGAIGGLVGTKEDGTIANCFFDRQTTLQVNGVGDHPAEPGVTGITTAEMQTQDTFTGATWNFLTIWGLYLKNNDTEIQGYGYPYLRIFGNDILIVPTGGSKIWDGNPAPTSVYTVSPPAHYDGVKHALTGALTYSGSDPLFTAVGNYAIVQNTLNNLHYQISFKNDEIYSILSSGKTQVIVVTWPAIVTEKEYDGTADLELDDLEFDFLGIDDDDEVEIVVTITYDNKNAGSGKKITITFRLEGKDAEKYTAPDDIIIDDCVITPKQLTIKAEDKTVLIGAPEPPYTYTTTGLVAGETVAVITTQPVFSLDRPFDNTQPGTFTITPSGAVAADYSITFIAGTLTVYGIVNLDLIDVKIDGQSGQRNGNTVNANAVCGANQALVNVIADPAATVKINGVAQNPQTVALPEYGENRFTITISAPNGDSETYTLIIARYYEKVEYEYPDVPSVNCNMQTNGGFLFTGFQWYRDGVTVKGATKPYYQIKDDATYYGEITVSDGRKFRTCNIRAQQLGGVLKAYPNPTQGQVTIENGEWNIENGKQVQVYDLYGRLVLMPSTNPFDMSVLPDGVYVIKVNGKTVKVIVKK